jgi:hypothetical protein
MLPNTFLIYDLVKIDTNTIKKINLNMINIIIGEIMQT